MQQPHRSAAVLLPRTAHIQVANECRRAYVRLGMTCCAPQVNVIHVPDKEKTTCPMYFKPPPAASSSARSAAMKLSSAAHSRRRSRGVGCACCWLPVELGMAKRRQKTWQKGWSWKDGSTRIQGQFSIAGRVANHAMLIWRQPHLRPLSEASSTAAL